MSPDALTTFVISISSSALCIGHSSSRTTSKSGLSATFCKTSMLVKKQGIIQRCYLFRSIKCLFCFQLNICCFSAAIPTRPVGWFFLDFRKSIWPMYLFLVTVFTDFKINPLPVEALLPKRSTISSNCSFNFSNASTYLKQGKQKLEVFSKSYLYRTFQSEKNAQFWFFMKGRVAKI